MQAMPATVKWGGAAGLAFAMFVLAQSHGSSAPFALPLLVFGCAVAVVRDELDFSLPPSAVEVSFGVFAASWLISAASGLDPMRSLTLSAPLPAAALLLVALGRSRTEQVMDVGLVALLAAAGIASMLVVAAAATGADAPAARVVSAGVSWLVVPNDIAWMACLWPAWVQLARDRWPDNGRAPFLVVALLVLQLVAFALLHSRLAIILAALAVGCRLLSMKLDRRALAALLATGLLASVLLLPLLAEKGLYSGGARLQLWKAAWNVFLQYPLTGVGPHNFALAYLDHLQPALLLDPRHTPWPHSLPLQLLAEGGLAIGAATVLLLTCATRSALRRGAMRIEVAAPFVLLCLVETSTLRAWFWMLAALWLGWCNRKPPNLPIGDRVR